MENDHSVITIVPAEHRPNLRLVRCAMGDDEFPGHGYTFPLSATGELPATHYASHTWTTSERAAMFAAMPTGGGTLPEVAGGWPYMHGGNPVLTEQDAKAACAGIARVSVMTGAVVPTSHLTDVIAGLGLQATPSEEDE